MGVEEVNGYWSGDVDISRTPSPSIPAKRIRMTLNEIADDFRQPQPWEDNEYNNLLRTQRTPEALGYENVDSFRSMWVSTDESEEPQDEKKKMQTGCIPCL